MSAPGVRARTTRIPLEQKGMLAAFLILGITFGSACDESKESCPSDLPDDWECAQVIDVLQVHADCQVQTEPTAVSVNVTQDLIVVQVRRLIFREEQGDICGYRIDSDSNVLLLLQPCEMHPDIGLKGRCYYDLDIPVSDPGGMEAVEVFRRYDYYGAEPGEEPPVSPIGVANLP